MNNLVKVSIIIATFRRGNQLLTVLGDLERCKQDWVEIIVVDQTPKEEYSQEIYKKLRELENLGLFRWINYPRNYVYEARNYGAAVSLGDLLWWLDDDVRVGADTLEKLVSYFNSYETLSVVQGNLIPEELFNRMRAMYQEADLTFQINRATEWLNKSRPIPENIKNKLLSLPPELQAFYCETGFAEPVTNCAWISANNMMVKREAFEAINGWDEYILNYGDRNLGIRISKANFKIQWAPEVSIVHLQNKTGGSRMSDPKNPIRGWRSCVSIWYLAFKYLYLHPAAFVKFGIYKAARYSFLLKRNSASLLLLIRNSISYIISAFIGLYWSWNKPLSSYNKWRAEYLNNQCKTLPMPVPLKRCPE
ncbi:glycosyltransferase family 2 protein [Kamptonema formosum]|uniref:glycosyltransferase family 2 protein n=1 Tax=Kamptonema formosum TaxID=331992 RepID=UPI00034C39AB|nr:glycosyltransferase [Oscillatoria sp. PCC 10802]